MTAVLSSPIYHTNRLREWSDRADKQAPELRTNRREPEGQQTVWPSVSILGGCSLLVYGALRGSWTGLALAAVGGWLVYRGFSQSDLRLTPRENPEIDESSAVSQDRLETNADPNLSSQKSQEDAAAEEGISPNATGGEVAEDETVVILELLPEEISLAHTIAYYFALERGGGQLPDFDHQQATEDFIRAAAQVLRARGSW